MTSTSRGLGGRHSKIDLPLVSERAKEKSRAMIPVVESVVICICEYVSGPAIVTPAGNILNFRRERNEHTKRRAQPAIRESQRFRWTIWRPQRAIVVVECFVPLAEECPTGREIATASSSWFISPRRVHLLKSLSQL